MAPSQQCNGTTGKKKDLTVSCDETKHETTSPEQDHSITSARSNGWAECRDKKVSAPSRRRRMSLDISFYRTSPVTLLYVRVNHFRVRLDTGKITRGEVSRRQRRSFYAYPTT